MKTRAMVLEKYNTPLKLREVEIGTVSRGETLVSMLASGICGSDVHIWRGRDPRTPLPLIPGHEGVGIIQKTRGAMHDVLGETLSPGDVVLWDRGIVCGGCYYCSVMKTPFLCPDRKTYGIMRNGCYAQDLVLLRETKILKIKEDVDPALLASASCSGATAAHAVESSNISPGDAVVIQGPGPLGIFALAFCLQKGARSIGVTGRGGDEARLRFCEEMGADFTVNIDEVPLMERIDLVRNQTGGRGANVVIECTGSPDALEDGLKIVVPGGTYCTPGIAVPHESIPINWYQDIVRKNLNLKGVWVSDTSHLYQAAKILEKGRFPFEKFVTHRFSLEEANEALCLAEGLKMIKGALEFSHGR